MYVQFWHRLLGRTQKNFKNILNFWFVMSLYAKFVKIISKGSKVTNFSKNKKWTSEIKDGGHPPFLISRLNKKYYNPVEFLICNEFVHNICQDYLKRFKSYRLFQKSKMAGGGHLYFLGWTKNFAILLNSWFVLSLFTKFGINLPNGSKFRGIQRTRSMKKKVSSGAQSSRVIWKVRPPGSKS